ncbi:DNA polymerase domain-containing protein [Candidatus Nitrosocosmicus hydrocola]|uniref:DNA polymerase domain-containing protein n=1 Tax=Candidatus Nitrosocosmicus hydrocola TaxID=1826872 RepID=UPI0011E5BF48|nr:DNA polymerase domain-containing protein [Candidatus Nitrosocosmicus hydrocola]
MTLSNSNIPSTTTNANYNIQRNELLMQPYAAFDLEFRYDENNSQKPYTIFAAAIVDSLGNIKAKHELDFGNNLQPEKELVNWIMLEILKYRLTIGWYTKGIRIKKKDKKGKERYSGKDSDLKIIDNVCKYHNIPSIIGFDKRGVPYIRGYNKELCNNDPFYSQKNRFDYYYHIDLYNVYDKKMVIDIYHGKYRDRKLSTVSKVLLGNGKLEDLDGRRIQQLPKDKQIEYVIRDASLVMDLSRHDNYALLDLMNAISVITQVSFDRVCNNGLSSLWTKVIKDNISIGQCRLPTTSLQERKKQKFKGGHVLDSKIGYYDSVNNRTVYIFDVKSLYPTMMIIYNISFETVNCSCCRDNPEARIPKEIMDLIIKKVEKDRQNQKERKEYWICKKYRGIIPRLLEHYRNERFKQKELGNEAMQMGLKILINGCYGLFGSEFFEFSDYRVSELTTAFGRRTLGYMKHIAEEVYGFNVIAGDTDSIFVTDVKSKLDINKFLAECSIILEDTEIELVKIYRKFLLLGKKHYIGIHTDENKDPDIVGMEGKKSDRPQWINNLQRDFAEDLKYGRDPTVKLRKAYLDMEKGQVPHELLAISLTLSKDPSEYASGDFQNIVGKQLRAKEGDAIKYYKANFPGKAHSDPGFIDRSKYLEMLQSTFEEQVKCLGYNYYNHVKGDTTLDDFWK